MSPSVFTFSSDTFKPDAKFSAYHDLYSVGCDVVRTQERFRASVKAFRFDRMLVFERRLAGVGHCRETERIRRDGFDHITLHLVLSGDLTSGPMGAERAVKPGEIIVLDSSLPHRNRNTETHTVSVSLARDQIAPMIPDVRPYHGTVLCQREAGVIADFILSMMRRHETLAAETSEQFGHVLGILTASALRGTTTLGSAMVGASQHDLGRRQQAEAYIDAHLGDQGLGAEGIAAEIGVSRSVLYRCFIEDGGVARFIQQRRLDRIRNLLRRRHEGDKLANIAQDFGFASEQHLSRAFRATFGQPPGQFRSTIERSRRMKAPVDARARAFSNWLVELY